MRNLYSTILALSIKSLKYTRDEIKNYLNILHFFCFLMLDEYNRFSRNEQIHTHFISNKYKYSNLKEFR